MDRDEARAAALLDRRTTALATRSSRVSAHLGEARPGEAAQPLIVWGLGEILFHTELGAVAAIVPFAGCARVPTREPAVLGVIGRGGRFYSVIGMRRLLSLAASDTEPGHLLLLRGAAPYLALAVDRVLGRFDFPAGGPALSFEGRLVAPMGPAELRDRLTLSSPPVPSLE